MHKNLSEAIEDYKKQADMTKVLEGRWIGMFLELVDYKNKNGHANVPAKYPLNKSLGYWVRRQRLVYHEGTMDLKRENLLYMIGFNFRLMAFHDWDNMYTKLLKFQKQFGHTNVTESNSDSQLQNWLVYQRKLYWKGKLHHSKIKKLKSAGVEMKNKTINRWEEMFDELVLFKKEHGHLLVCSSYGAKNELVNFMKVLRRTKDTMSKERKEKLNDLGFNWNPQQSVTALLNKERANEQWLIRYEELKEYKQQFGTCYIVTTSKNYKSLANWVSIQRTHISKLSKERISLLNEIDFFKDNQQEIKR